jgi:hypothetical protein
MICCDSDNRSILPDSVNGSEHNVRSPTAGLLFLTSTRSLNRTEKQQRTGAVGGVQRRDAGGLRAAATLINGDPFADPAYTLLP